MKLPKKLYGYKNFTGRANVFYLCNYEYILEAHERIEELELLLLDAKYEIAASRIRESVVDGVFLGHEGHEKSLLEDLEEFQHGSDA